MNTKKKTSSTRQLVLAGLFIALGLVMPFLTAQVPAVGSKLLPMHIPVLISGFVLGWPYALLVGFLTPLLRSVIFTMPRLYPTAVSMAFELAAYGAVTSILYHRLPKKNVMVYASLIGAMICGRLVMGAANMILYGVQGNVYSWSLFIAGAFFNAIPGIAVQIVLIPALVLALEKAKVLKLNEEIA